MRTRLFTAVAAGLVLLGLLAGVVYAYDTAREDSIADGVTIGGIDVSGMSRSEATATLREQLLAPLARPVVVRARGETFRLPARRARVVADLDGTITEAVGRSRTGNMLTRTFREVTGGEVGTDVDPRISYSRPALARFVAKISEKTERPARDASVSFAAAGLSRVPGRDGFALDEGSLRRKVATALFSPSGRTVRARFRVTKPETTMSELEEKYATVVTVDRANYTLRLFKDLELSATYPIAVGQVGLETPAGLYDIQNKAVDPAWNVPNSDWAGDLAGQVIPGGAPNNPLKARWLGIYGGAGIHGTSEAYSIGSSASHGCIRMLIDDVIELYDEVPVGAPVYIA